MSVCLIMEHGIPRSEENLGIYKCYTAWSMHIPNYQDFSYVNGNRMSFNWNVLRVQLEIAGQKSGLLDHVTTIETLSLSGNIPAVNIAPSTNNSFC